jgi:nicotinate-nucleotide adenylyltransferase
VSAGEAPAPRPGGARPRRIGVFGGSFDPVHFGHLLVAETAREALALDRVLWIPAGIPPHKTGRALAPAAARLRMVEAAIQGNPAFEADDLELRSGGPSYTASTLRLLKEKHPGAELVVLLGSDSLLDLPAWREPGTILAHEIGVYPRPGFDPAAFDAAGAGRVRLLDAPGIALSSSEIRERLRLGRTVRYRIPDGVLALVRAEGLYQGGEGPATPPRGAGAP